MRLRIILLKPTVTFHYLYGRLQTYREICENDHEMQKTKAYSGVFRATFFTFRAPFFAFCILQHFALGSAFARKLEAFCNLFFRGINKTRNSPEMQKVYSECFVFYGVFCKNIHEIPAKCEI